MWLWPLVGVHGTMKKRKRASSNLASSLMSSSDPNDLPKDLLPNTVNVVLKFPTVKSERHLRPNTALSCLG